MIEDSPYRCRKCSKRMQQEVDPEFIGTRLRIEHFCWSCDYRRVEYVKPAGGFNPAAAERLARLRNA